jgi:adenylate kinase family enzyme
LVVSHLNIESGMRIILLGNAGAGKSTMARRLIGARNIARLSLDEIAWAEGTARKLLVESLTQLQQFIDYNEQWIIEGCYSDLVEAALPYCSELRFLNPGVEVCIQHCQQRPWEPEKFPSVEAQQAMLARLVEWVREYEVRDDEYGLERHRKLFDDFVGPKREYTNVSTYDEG